MKKNVTIRDMECEVFDLEYKIAEKKRKLELFETQQKNAQKKHQSATARMNYAHGYHSTHGFEHNYYHEMSFSTDTLNDLTEEINKLHADIKKLERQLKSKKAEIAHKKASILSTQNQPGNE